MPNYVQNILNIEGDKKEVDKVLKAVSNAYRTFDFERLIERVSALSEICGRIFP